MDNTVDRVRLKNEELKDQLRSLIQQETPYRKSGRNTVSDELDKENVAETGTTRTSKIRASNPNPPSPRTSFTTPSVKTQTPVRKPESRMPHNTASPSRSRIPVLNPPTAASKSPPKKYEPKRVHIPIPRQVSEQPTYEALKKPSSAESNLLLTKITNQGQEIDQLKQYIKQLKQENNVLQQDSYSKLSVIRNLKHESAVELRQVKQQYEESSSQHKLQQDRMMESINSLTRDNTQLKSDLARKESEVKIIKEVLKTVNDDLNGYKVAEHNESSRIHTLIVYNSIMKKLIQSNIVNKLTDDFEQLGILIDQQVDTKLVHHFDHNGRRPEVNVDDNISDDGDTTDLIKLNRDDTTNLLINHKSYVSLEKLVINSIKAKKDARTRLRVYIRFIICANRFKNGSL